MTDIGPTERLFRLRKIQTDDHRIRHVRVPVRRPAHIRAATFHAVGRATKTPDHVRAGTMISKDAHEFIRQRAIANGRSISLEIAALIERARG